MDAPQPFPAPEPEISRHSIRVRVLHWLLAAAFILTMATGMTLYWASILGWLAPVFGGKILARQIHFWGGIAFVAILLPLFADWLRKMRWTPADTRFVQNLRDIALNPGRQQPPDVGFFNGGQKAYFWATVATAVIFLGTGLVWWYRKEVPHPVYAVCRTSHRVFGVVMSGLLFVHIYKATLGEPGTLRSMIGGRVTADWARRRRPAWRGESK